MFSQVPPKMQLYVNKMNTGRPIRTAPGQLVLWTVLQSFVRPEGSGDQYCHYRHEFTAMH